MVTYAGGLAALLHLGHTRSTGPVTPPLTRHIASATNFSNRYNFLTPFMQIKKKTSQVTESKVLVHIRECHS